MTHPTATKVTYGNLYGYKKINWKWLELFGTKHHALEAFSLIVTAVILQWDNTEKKTKCICT